MGLQEISSADDKLLQEIADILAGSHKILLVTGAGISTSCGIPVRVLSLLCREGTDMLRISDPKTDSIISYQTNRTCRPHRLPRNLQHQD